MAERPNALVLKTRELIAPGVQIPPPPPFLLRFHFYLDCLEIESAAQIKVKNTYVIKSQNGTYLSESGANGTMPKTRSDETAKNLVRISIMKLPPVQAL